SGERRALAEAMERYATGDAAAFRDLHAALAPRIYAYLSWRTGDPDLANDLLQQTLLHVHRARCRYIPGADVLPCVLAIARRLAMGSARTAPRQIGRVSEAEILQLPAPGAPPDEVAHARQLASNLEVGMARLPPQQREALELLKGQNLS